MQDIRRCVRLLGIKTNTVALRVAWLKHMGRQVILPSQVQPPHALERAA